MKKRIYRVLSVALTVMLLTGLMLGLAAAPAAAQTDNTWVRYPTPVSGAVGGWMMSPLIEALGPMDVAFDNSAIYVGAWIDLNQNAVIDPTEIHVLKSVKGSSTYMGKVWTQTGYNKVAIGTPPTKLVDMACSPIDANVVYVTDGTYVYWSDDGGTTFEALSSPPVMPGTIKGIDVGYIGTTPYIFAGTAGNDPGGVDMDDVFVCEQAIFGMPWAALNVLTNRAVGLPAPFSLANIGDIFTLTVSAGSRGTITITAPSAATITTTGTATWTAATSTWTGGASGGTVVVRATANNTTGTWTRTLGTVTTAAITTDLSPFSLPDVGDAFTITVGAGATGTVSAAAAVTVALTVTGTATFALAPADPNFTWSGGATGGTVVVTALAAASGTWGTYLTGTATAAITTDPSVPPNATVGNPSATVGQNVITGVFDVECSRGFGTDQMVMACASTPTDTYLTLKYAGGQWGATVPDTTFSTGAVVMPVTGDASFAFRDTFDSSRTSGNMIILCGLNDGPAAGNGGTYTFTWDALADFTNAWTKSRSVGSGGGANAFDAYDLAVSGTTTQAGMLSGKMTGDAGQPVYVRFAKDYASSRQLWAVTNQATDADVAGDVDLCAMSFTTGSTTFAWNQISLIGSNIDQITDIAPTADWFFMATTDTQATTGLPSATLPTNSDKARSLWRYDGKDWKRIAHESLTFGAGPSALSLAFLSNIEASMAWQTDLTLVVIDTTTSPSRQWYSTNGGEAFSAYTVAPAAGTVSAAIVVDRNNWLLGSSAGKVFRLTNMSSGWPWTTYNTGSTGNVVSFAEDPKLATNILACTDLGEVFFSDNQGLTWTATPAAGMTVGGAAGTANAAFDPNYATNKTLYATNSGANGVFRLRVGTDSAWVQIAGIANTWPQDQLAARSTTNLNGRNPMVGSDGTLYALDLNNPPVSRCVNPRANIVPAVDAPYFETVGMAWPASAPYGLWMTSGSNKLWTISANTAQIWNYADKVTTPSLSSPAKGTSSGRTDEVTLTWSAVPVATRYQVFLATDSGFDNLERAVQTGDTTVRITGLEDGRTYYWRVAVFAQSPAVSLWSTVYDFTTELGAAQWNPFIGGVPEAPSNGATGVSRTPTFAWNAADWATGYEFQLSTDPTFATTIDSKTGSNAVTTTVYSPAVTLDYSTTYYWRVRAVAGSTFSEYGVGVFTTEAAPLATPTPPTSTPTPTPTPPPVTPMYIWVIIGIGAALVIAVIVLIIRTRRVA